MKWMLENKFSYDDWSFLCAAKNGNIENMRWLLENKFSYNRWTIVRI